MKAKNTEKTALIIHPGDVITASKEYQKVVTPYYRAEAASTIQSACRHWSKVKKARQEVREAETQDLTQPVTTARRERLWKERKERFEHIRRMKKLEEPADFDEAFNSTLLNAIQQNEYHRINFKQKDFTACLFRALRLGHITMNQMMTAKLMYDSLICFNKGKMPEDPAEFFQRFNLSDASGPYQPAKDISYWTSTDTQQLQLNLQMLISMQK